MTEIAENLISDFLAEKGLILYDSEFVKEGADHILRIFIDKKEGYIGTEDCEAVSNFLSDALDREDPIEQNYILEVSSPGLDRLLRKDEHFARYMGETVDVSLYRPVKGSKKITGVMKEKTPETLTLISEDGTETVLKMNEIARVNLAVII